MRKSFLSIHKINSILNKLDPDEEGRDLIHEMKKLLKVKIFNMHGGEALGIAITKGILNYVNDDEAGLPVDFQETIQETQHDMRCSIVHFASKKPSSKIENSMFSLWVYDDEEENSDEAKERNLSATVKVIRQCLENAS